MSRDSNTLAVETTSTAVWKWYLFARQEPETSRERKTAISGVTDTPTTGPHLAEAIGTEASVESFEYYFETKSTKHCTYCMLALVSGFEYFLKERKVDK